MLRVKDDTCLGFSPEAMVAIQYPPPHLLPLATSYMYSLRVRPPKPVSNLRETTTFLTPFEVKNPFRGPEIGALPGKQADTGSGVNLNNRHRRRSIMGTQG